MVNCKLSEEMTRKSRAWDKKKKSEFTTGIEPMTFHIPMFCTTSDKQISRTFQGFFYDKLQFSMVKIYEINHYSLTPHPIG